MRNTLAAALLIIGLAAHTAAAQTTNRSWTGDALRYTPSTVAGCSVKVMEAATSNGFVVVTLRQSGTGTFSFSLAGELAGNGKRSIATVTTRLPAGLNVRLTMMRLYEGSLAGSVLTLHGSACSVIG